MSKFKTDYIITSMSLLLLLFVSISASYAYFASKVSNNGILNVSANTSTAATFTAYAVDQIEFDVTAEDLFVASTAPSKSDTGNVVSVLASPTEGKTVYCTYDIVFVWDTTNQYTSPSGALSGDYKYEISLKGSQAVTGDTTGHKYANTTLAETNLTNFTWVKPAGTIGRYATVVSGAEIYSKSTTQTKSTWTFTLNFYTIPSDQTSLTGKTYGAHLGVTNVVC